MSRKNMIMRTSSIGVFISATTQMQIYLLLLATTFTLLRQATATLDKFEWFRCDACRATFHQLQKQIANVTSIRPNVPLKDYEFLDLLEEKVCSEKSFDKRTYGVKQYEEKYYLFGPGIIDHLGDDKGFGQMGMGDYDQRLISYCQMFTEKVGEEKLMQMGTEIDKEKLCEEECKTSMSGASDPEEMKAKDRRAGAKKKKRKATKVTWDGTRSSSATASGGGKKKKKTAGLNSKTDIKDKDVDSSTSTSRKTSSSSSSAPRTGTKSSSASSADSSSATTTGTSNEKDENNKSTTSAKTTSTMVDNNLDFFLTSVLPELSIESLQKLSNSVSTEFAKRASGNHDGKKAEL
ncbi:unnamed protein product [Amoebophrya sp. A120]|nr:unnamed protein product [Amoebophrya sp. A120]|eukprot:GSA120T00021914001.1